MEELFSFLDIRPRLSVSKTRVLLTFRTYYLGLCGLGLLFQLGLTRAERLNQSLLGGLLRNSSVTPLVFGTGLTRLPQVPKVPITPYDVIITRAARHYQLDPLLIKAVIKIESNYDPHCRSTRGARGLMQLMPRTARILGVKRIDNPYQNIWAGTRYLNHQMIAFHGNLQLALAAYNAGPAPVKHFHGIPPYRETQNYVKGVLRTYHQYLPD